MKQIASARSGHVVIDVDIHKHIHVAAVMDPIGGILVTLEVATDRAGFHQLVEWAAGFGRIIARGGHVNSDARARRRGPKLDTAGQEAEDDRLHCASLRPRGLSTPEEANPHVLKSLARRWLALNEEILELEVMIKEQVIAPAPHLLDQFGIGVDTSAEFLTVAGDNPERIKSEAAFAKLAGISLALLAPGSPVASIRSTKMITVSWMLPSTGRPSWGCASTNPLSPTGTSHRGGQVQASHHLLPEAACDPRALSPGQDGPSHPRNRELTTTGTSTPWPRPSTRSKKPS